MSVTNSDKQTYSAFVNMVCKCGYILVITDNETAFCENPKCPGRGTAYKILVKIVEIKPVKTV